ncbi:Methyltransferase domain-containing protein [Pseudomonas cedrina]|uniref:Methyltransferase n=2 Tax=Pseudomonas cedrina TaxID=651740 RepID=A0A1V2KGJ6_PSECE|nr:methyltransferase domain-containing protein [Pseudomonas cedrina]ONH56719.1 methyltransferase [Pseudomonas cedrina subsp. cedrina]SDS15831.1 Methyltransferase domain-containing protein [Pseudomonas cedrina]
MDLKETEILGDAINDHWYYSSKVKAVEKFLGETPINTILDIGAGSGFFSKHLLQHTSAKEAWCVDISYASESDEIYLDKPLYLRKSIQTIDVDLVMLMDVLEHVDDDIGLLKEYVEKVPSGATFLITVPAFKFLWSGHDDFLEHKRRYTLLQMESVVEASGLELKKGAYFFGGVFPIAAALRLADRSQSKARIPKSQLAQHSRFTNALLKGICDLELPIMNFNRVAGLSVFCVAQKP